MNLSPLPIQKFFDNNGRPLARGQLFTYAAGTSTKLATYIDAGGLTANTNPIILDFRGECRLWIDPTLAYKYVLAREGDTDPPSAPIWTVDNITAAPNDLDNAAVDTGVANAIALAIPRISAPVAFTRIIFRAVATNTGATTISINGGTAKALTWQNVGALAGGEIQANGLYEAIYDGARWQLQGPTLGPQQMRTAVEVTDSVTPSNFAYVSGDSRRYGISVNWDSVGGWFDYGPGATRIDDDEFSVPGDQTARFGLHRRVKVYGTGGTVAHGIVRNPTVFGAGVTPVEIGLDSGVLPNPIVSVAVQMNTNATQASSIVTNVNGELYTLLVGNISDGADALGRHIVGCGQESNGAFEAAIALVAVNSANAADGGGPWDVSSSAHCVLQTGAPNPIGIVTGDVMRMYFDGAGAASVITTDLVLDKSALINNNCELAMNGVTDSKIELRTGATERAMFYTSATEILLGSVTNIDFSLIQNNARVVTFNGPNNTGASTPTLSANKPGANAGVIAWISVKTGAGTQGWIPIFGN